MSGQVTTLAGGGATGGLAGWVDGWGSSALFSSPQGIAVSSSGAVVWVADTSNNRMRSVTLAGYTTTLAGSLSAGTSDGVGLFATFSAPRGVTVDVAGFVYVADGSNRVRRMRTLDGWTVTAVGSGTAGFVNGVGSAARFSSPRGVTYDATSDAVFVADTCVGKGGGRGALQG